MIWSSGRTDEEGAILGPSGQPLPSESFQTGPDGKQQYQEHHNAEFPITREDEVQIYEELVQDAEGKFTTSFLRRDVEFKDNRLLPIGWTHEGPDPTLKHFFLEATYPKGRAASDKVYLAGKGQSIVRYRVQLPAGVDPANVRVKATLYYQSTPPYYLQDRFKTPGPNGQRLEYLAGHLDLSDTPLKDWKLEITSATSAATGAKLKQRQVSYAFGGAGRAVSLPHCGPGPKVRGECFLRYRADMLGRAAGKGKTNAGRRIRSG